MKNLIMSEAEKNAAAAAYAWIPLHKAKPYDTYCVVPAAVYHEYRRFFPNTVYGGFILGMCDLSRKTLEDRYAVSNAYNTLGIACGEYESVKGIWSL